MSQIKITINDRDIAAVAGQTLLQVILDAEIPIDTACGGQARCHLCRVTITEGRENLPKASAIEYKALGNVLIAQGMRLACQTEVAQSLSVTVPEPRPRRRRGPMRATGPSAPPARQVTSSRSSEKRPPASEPSAEDGSGKKKRRRRPPRRHRSAKE
jgi:ferredoxin